MAGIALAIVFGGQRWQLVVFASATFSIQFFFSAMGEKYLRNQTLASNCNWCIRTPQILWSQNSQIYLS